MFNLYSVRDTVAKVFLPPFQMKLDGEAMRAFSYEVNSGTGPTHRHPYDFELWFVGTFNETTGEFGKYDGRRLCSGTDVLLEGESPSDVPGPLGV